MPSDSLVRLPAGSADRNILCLPLEIKRAALSPAEEGIFEGYASVFGNRDSDGDQVAPGAFSESLKEILPALLWQHKQAEPIGRFTEVREDTRGLYVKGQLAMSGRGEEAYELLKMGALDGLSIGFVAKEASRDQTTGVRTIHKADLMEVSLVTFPANKLARVSSVKSTDGPDHGPKVAVATAIWDGTENGIQDVRAFERFLRKSGFSRARAKAITAKGFKGAEQCGCNGQSKSNLIGSLVEDLAKKQYRLTAEVKDTTAREEVIIPVGKSVSISFDVDYARTYSISLTSAPETNRYAGVGSARVVHALYYANINGTKWSKISRPSERQRYKIGKCQEGAGNVGCLFPDDPIVIRVQNTHKSKPVKLVASVKAVG